MTLAGEVGDRALHREADKRSARPHGRGGLTLACRLLPADVRDDVFLLYGALRRVEDLVDGDADSDHEP